MVPDNPTKLPDESGPIFGGTVDGLDGSGTGRRKFVGIGLDFRRLGQVLRVQSMVPEL